jgi:spore maturation protein CgeB
MNPPYDIVILGLSITSSWGNGHATTWRSLVKGLGSRGRRVLFLEREQPWYAENRDLDDYPYCDVRLYSSLAALREQYAAAVGKAGAVIVGSYVPDGIDVSAWVLQTARGVCAFYDIDTPVTLAALQRGDCRYITADLVPGFALYMSFTAGPVCTSCRPASVRAGRCRCIAVSTSMNTVPSSGHAASISATWERIAVIANPNCRLCFSILRANCPRGGLSWPERNIRRRSIGRVMFVISNTCRRRNIGRFTARNVSR